jgi:hypothetical protein
MSVNWQTLLLPIALGGMQISWLVLPIFIFNTKWTGSSLPWFGIFLFYPVAFGLNRFFQNRKRLRKYSLPLCAIAGIAIYGAFLGSLMIMDLLPKTHSWIFRIVRSGNPQNPEFFFLITAGVLWGLGYRLASLKISSTALLSELQFGLAILFVALFVEQKSAMNFPHLVPLILFFFSFALFGAGIAHGRDHAGWTSNRYLHSWIGLLLTAIALVLSAGLIIAVLVSPSFVQFLLSLLYQAGKWVIEVLAKILRFLLGFLPPPESTILPPPVPAMPRPKPEDWSPFFLFSDSVREVLRALWTIMVSSVLLVALWRVSSQILDWMRRRMGNMAGEEVEPLPGAFRADLRILLTWILDALTLRWLFRWRQRKKRMDVRADSVRQVYRRLLKWSGAKGCGRDMAQTPFDYLPRLLEFLPEARQDFTFITHQYVQSRYGSLALPAHIFEKVKGCWRNIQRIEAAQRKRQKKRSEA